MKLLTPLSNSVAAVAVVLLASCGSKGSQQQPPPARQQYEQAQAAARATCQNVAHARLYAPIAGYIGSKQVDRGAVAGPGTAVATIVQLSQVNVAVPEAEINHLHKGGQATVRVAAAGNSPLVGRLDEVSPVAFFLSASASASPLLH